MVREPELKRTILKDEYPLAMHCSISEQSVSPCLLFYLFLSENLYDVRKASINRPERLLYL